MRPDLHITPEQEKEMQKMFDSGYSFKEIGERFNRAPYIIRKHVKGNSELGKFCRTKTRLIENRRIY